MKQYNIINRRFQQDISLAIKESLKNSKMSKQILKLIPEEIKKHCTTIKNKVVAVPRQSQEKQKQALIKEIQEIFENGTKLDHAQQKKYFSVDVIDHEYDDL